MTPILTSQWFQQLHRAQAGVRTCFCNQAAQLYILQRDGYCAIQTMPHYTEVHSFDFTKEAINITKSIAGKHDFMPGFFSSLLLQRINEVVSERGISLRWVMIALFVWLASSSLSLPGNIWLLQHLKKRGSLFSNQKNKSVTFYFRSLIQRGLRMGREEEVIMLDIKM